MDINSYTNLKKKLPTFKKRFINELPGLINYPISIDITDEIIRIKYEYKKIIISIQITSDYPWTPPLTFLNNISYSEYIKSNFSTKILRCSDNNILYSNYIKSNIYNISNISNTSDIINISNTYSRYEENSNHNIYGKYNIYDKTNEQFICLCCKSITNKMNWYPTRKLSELIDETKNFIDYKQHGIIMLMLRVIKRKYLVNDIPLEDFMNYKLVL